MQNLSLLPAFPDIESLFSAPLSPAFLPSNEVPNSLPDMKLLARMARSIFPHWKERREKRKGWSIMPALNVINASILRTLDTRSLMAISTMKPMMVIPTFASEDGTSELLGRHGGPTISQSRGCKRYRLSCEPLTSLLRWCSGGNRRSQHCIK